MLGVLAGLIIGLNCETELGAFKSDFFVRSSVAALDVRDRFFDQADRVTASDDLIGAILNSGLTKSFGVSLPRLGSSSLVPLEFSSVLMGQNQVPNSLLSEFGLAIAVAIGGRMFVDLAAGYPDISQAPAAIAAHFGASHYVAVDHLNIEKDMVRNRVPLTGTELQSFYFRDEILSFMSRLVRPPQGLVIHIAGLEPITRDQRLRITRDIERLPSSYLYRLMNRIEDLMTLEDFLVLGPLTIGLQLEQRTFIKRVSVPTPRGEYQIWQKAPPKIWPQVVGDLKFLEP